MLSLTTQSFLTHSLLTTQLLLIFVVCLGVKVLKHTHNATGLLIEALRETTWFTCAPLLRGLCFFFWATPLKPLHTTRATYWPHNTVIDGDESFSGRTGNTSEHVVKKKHEERMNSITFRRNMSTCNNRASVRRYLRKCFILSAVPRTSSGVFSGVITCGQMRWACECVSVSGWGRQRCGESSGPRSSGAVRGADTQATRSFDLRLLPLGCISVSCSPDTHWKLLSARVNVYFALQTAIIQ